MDSSSGQAPIGVLGGTFNPVHYGHLRSALELVEKLRLEKLHLMPCANPSHREAPQCSAQHRAAMVELAVAREPQLLCDTRELMRSGPSYMIDSLMELRDELGEQRSLCMVLGCDAVIAIDTWHRWEELLDWAHIVIIARPGWSLPEQGKVAKWLQAHRVEKLDRMHTQSAGDILVEELRPLAISSTEIRELLAARRSPRYLLPPTVLDYIEEHHLYQ